VPDSFDIEADCDDWSFNYYGLDIKDVDGTDYTYGTGGTQYGGFRDRILQRGVRQPATRRAARAMAAVPLAPRRC
jgi:hypothetical protein